MITKSVFDYSWIDEISPNEHFLIIAEGLLMYFNKDEVKNLMDKLVESFKGAEMLLEAIPELLVKKSEKEDIIKNQYQINAQFHWGIKKSKELEDLNNKFKLIEEYYYFDYHKDIWRTIRWLNNSRI